MEQEMSADEGVYQTSITTDSMFGTTRMATGIAQARAEMIITTLVEEGAAIATSLHETAIKRQAALTTVDWEVVATTNNTSRR